MDFRLGGNDEYPVMLRVSRSIQSVKSGFRDYVRNDKFKKFCNKAWPCSLSTLSG
jgi:hypothetical protein